ncbi:restriction endonuclease subunit S [Bifidobacterium longum]|uniref:restriction endonuclease subunit S n=1 Tax=Bifidobacterium longum TaxID=216816 RepID=UPI00103D5ABA|nr:restriction endonuclease S subunit [Bifidobacterium longum subsp. longum]
MTEQAKVPAIRFAGFTDPWEQRELVDIAEIVGGGTPDTNNSNYWDGDIDWYAPAELGNNIYAESSTRKITQAGFDSCSTKMLPADKTILFTSRAGIGNTAILRHSACTNQGFQSLVIGDADVYFVYSMSERIKKWAEEKASGSTFLEISGRQLETMPVNLPSLVEQQAIGSFFSHLDDLITLHQRKYDKLVIFKKSMLEKMFPKDGESVPEIRFAGFTDPWEQRKLGDVASSFDYGLNAAATEYDGQNKYLRITDIDDETHEFSKSDLTTPLADLAMSADYLLKEGDLLFARTGASVGKTYLYRQFDGMVYFAGFLIRARIGEGADPEFAYQATLTDAYKKYVAITSQRSGQPGVNAQEYADYQLMLPSKTEQQQIGMTLRSLDDLITLHQRKLELLQDIKKSLLDKMFV